MVFCSLWYAWRAYFDWYCLAVSFLDYPVFIEPTGIRHIILALPRNGRILFSVTTWEWSTPTTPNNTESLQEFRGKLNDPSSDVWIQAGMPIGAEFWRGVIYRTSKMGTSFEARMDASASAGDFELPHLFRKSHCTCVSGSSSSNGKSDRKKHAVAHFARAAYSGLNEPHGKSPIIPPPGGWMPSMVSSGPLGRLAYLCASSQLGGAGARACRDSRHVSARDFHLFRKTRFQASGRQRRSIGSDH